MDVVGGVKALIKTSSVQIDNFICQLHYRVTVIIVAIGCVIIGASQYIGSPIHCIGHTGWDKDYINTHCWVSTTYSTIRDTDGKIVRTPKETEGVSVVYHSYYQWMPFYLVFVATCFYLPRLIWKTWEGGLMKAMVAGLDDIHMKDEDVKDKLKTRVRYFINKKNNHNGYLARFCICESLNFINVILQFVLFNKFLGGQFFSYGSKAMEYFLNGSVTESNPMNAVFPLSTSCDLTWGAITRSQKTKSSQQCLLPQNVINDKITLILWFWFVFLVAVTICSVIYRVAYFLSPYLVRVRLQSHSQLSQESTICFLNEHCSTGDCWFLQQMSKNMHPEYLLQLLAQLQENLQQTASDNDSSNYLLDTTC